MGRGHQSDNYDVAAHFTERSATYDRSSHWVTDPVLRERVLSILQPAPHMWVLDIACGTGLVSAWFHGRVRKVIGLDLTPAMAEQAKGRNDHLVIGDATKSPFPDRLFDVAIERQGIQFMDDTLAVREMARVTRPGGAVCVIQLCAYGPEDRAEYFEVLRLRNPARRNYYERADLATLLRDAGLGDVVVHEHRSREDVDVWTDHRAIPEERREAIRECYRNASTAFRNLHAVEVGDAIVDNMLFGIAVGRVPSGPEAWLRGDGKLHR
jgi:SAM-dependent methyltransferase